MGIMGEETVECLIREAYRLVESRGFVSFAFQGGEPLLAGLDFFRRFTERARTLKPADVRLAFSIQTNGTLLNEDWVRFLREENFLVGLSMDGFPELHNAHRVDADGKGSWNQVSKGLSLLKKAHVPVNALCVVTAQCARSPQKAYQTLKKLGFRYIQFIACLDPSGAARGTLPWSLEPYAYGRFLCQLFDLWFRDWEKGDYHSIRLFEDYVHLLLCEDGSTCATCGHCGSYFAVEADGSVYPCDFYALDEWLIGNLCTQPLDIIMENDTFRNFLNLGLEKPSECSSCFWGPLCAGGCKNDWVQAENGIHNYYCSAFRMLFSYAGDRMVRIARSERTLRNARYGKETPAN